MDLKRTPLYDEHVKLKARMVPFGGWDMPVQYEGILDEYKHTREAVTLFDISHMGEFIIEGNLRDKGLDCIVTMPLESLPVKSSRYGLMLNDQGGVIDDLIVFRLEQEKWFIVVNGATTDKDATHFKKHLSDKARFLDVSMQTGKLDLQGPLSREVLSFLVDDVTKLDYFKFDFFNLLGEQVLISRTGYTGELGYEIFYPWDKTKQLWQALLNDQRVKPAGLGARDVLRLEMGYSLYGHEIDEHISPLEAGLKRFIDFKKDFLGKDALGKQVDQRLKRTLVGFISDSRRSPRSEQKIYSIDHQDIGFVTSGTFSPYLEKGIGLGLVPIEFNHLGAKIFFGDEKSKSPAIISEKTFYKIGSLRH